MKVTQWLVIFSLLSLLASCGKDNKTGKSGTAINPLGIPPYDPVTGIPIGFNPISGTGGINSPYSFGGGTLNQVMMENPCISGYGGYQMPTGSGAYAAQRIETQIPLTNFPTVIAPNDVYVGVTSYGDVAALVGTSPGQPPLFVGYMCPRSFTTSGQGQLLNVTPGVSTQCIFKPIVKAAVVFPGGASADFRMLDYGSSMKQKFSVCR